MFLLRRNQVVDLCKQELKTVANILPAFSGSKLANVEDFLNVNKFFEWK